MSLISFADTLAPLLAGAKTCTRRLWVPKHAAQFHAEQVVDAWDKLPRAHGHAVGTIRLTQAPYLEPISQLPDADYAAEGFAWLHDHPQHIPRLVWGVPAEDLSPAWFDRQRARDLTFWVIRFRLTAVWPEAREAHDGD